MKNKTKEQILAWLYNGAENMAVMTRQYLETALWSSTDGDGEPMDRNYSISNYTRSTLVKAIEDCEQFYSKVKDKLTILDNMGQIGHNFWLTRNHHGAGFWDGDYEKELGKYLTDVSHEFGVIDLYVGDSGKLYFS